MDDKGLEHYHSTNSDIFEMATRIYKISALIGYIKTYDLKLDNISKE